MFNSEILTYKNIPIIFSLFFAFLIIVCVTYFVFTLRKSKKEEEAFLEQLQMASNSLVNDKEKEKPLTQQWEEYWGKLLRQSEVIEMETSDKKAGIGIIVLMIFVWIIFSILTRNFGIGIAPMILTPIFASSFAKNKIQKKVRLMEEQIPSFVSALRSNVQANQTPEQALIEAIDMTSEPLYNELKIAKNFVATSSFTVALTRLREHSSSKDIQFLCSCVELSSKLGANIEEQLTIIESMIAEKRELDRMVDKAVQENKSLMYIPPLFAIGLFIFSYVAIPAAKNFWFIEPISWLVFFGIIAVYALALFAVKKLIKSVQDFR